MKIFGIESKRQEIQIKKCVYMLEDQAKKSLRSHGGCRIIGPKVAKFLDSQPGLSSGLLAITYISCFPSARLYVRFKQRESD